MLSRTHHENVAKPFLKWAGGKRQLLPEIQARLPADIDQCTTYVEPFVGAGAVLFHLLENYQFENVHIADINPEIILCYRVLQSSSQEVFRELQVLIDAYPVKEKNDTQDPQWFRNMSIEFIENGGKVSKIIDSLKISKSTYYSWKGRNDGPPCKKKKNKAINFFLKERRRPIFNSLREKWNQSISNLVRLSKAEKISRVAQTIFLNKTCYNGLYRVNDDGEFNVPIGSYINPSFPTEEQLIDVQASLQDVKIHHCSFEKCMDWVDGKSFIYFDPPYRPLSETSNFTSYTEGDFDDDDQRKLSNLFRELDSLSVLLLLSNSDPKETDPSDDFFDDLYSDYTIDRVRSARNISSKGKKRQKISEIMVRNYE
ncbi:MAG: hypothetical protein CMB65_03945 [Euryarchaeota archaeon]|nr:hypothetical protein [Euryarchaeota archaeon]